MATKWEWDPVLSEPAPEPPKAAEEFDPFDNGDAEEARQRAAERVAAAQKGKSLGDFGASVINLAIHGDPERNGEIKPKRKAKANHHHRTLNYVQSQWPMARCEKVEQNFQTRSGFFVKRDYLGFIDYLVHTVDGQTIALQVTSKSGKSGHVTKMVREKRCWEYVRSGLRVVLLLFDKVGARWQPIPIEITEQFLLDAYEKRKKLGEKTLERKRKKAGWY